MPTTLLQLDPPLPVLVLPGSDLPGGPGWAFGWLDYSQEHHLLWVVALDDGGAVYVVPNAQVRLQLNRTMGRKPALPGVPNLPAVA